MAYLSQFCSACPPPEHWISQLTPVPVFDLSFILTLFRFLNLNIPGPFLTWSVPPVPTNSPALHAFLSNLTDTHTHQGPTGSASVSPTPAGKGIHTAHHHEPSVCLIQLREDVVLHLKEPIPTDSKGLRRNHQHVP